VVAKIPASRGYRIFQVCNALVLSAVVVATLYPFLNLLAQSFSSETAIAAGRVNLIPKGFNLTTYKTVMSDPSFWENYRNTVEYTVVATLIAMVLTTCYAYVLSKKHIRGRGFLIGVAVFTMFFNGGLIPNYVLVNDLGLRNSLWAIVLPNAISVFNLLVMKAFFENMPSELEEAAAVDGLTTYGILFRIVLPLSKAVLATMVLFYAQPDRRGDRGHQRGRLKRHGVAGRGQHPGSDDRAHRPADPDRLPVRPALFRLGRDARRGQGLTAILTPPRTKEFP
jgi:putative aldouronate transport system permease protein